MITEFRGPWTRLSNYSLCSIWYKDKMYPSVEHAYQAMKSLDPQKQANIRNASTPNMAKKIGRTVEVRPDWEDFKLPLMRELIEAKFIQEPERSILISTGDKYLIEGNYWGDKFWGQCPVGVGENWLGKILMETRDKINQGLL